ncbi:MAG: NADH-quinone oxidoreductase subunit K [Planctomycetes bacterium]|nr:NADH-quinone oxidoreductase subunit K [Planctomycetota bacterium]
MTPLADIVSSLPVTCSILLAMFGLHGIVNGRDIFRNIVGLGALASGIAMFVSLLSSRTAGRALPESLSSFFILLSLGTSALLAALALRLLRETGSSRTSLMKRLKR